ncbi:MAG: transglycosylase SLT domain-containing protein [Polyangiaceae bacterium]
MKPRLLGLLALLAALGGCASAPATRPPPTMAANPVVAHRVSVAWLPPTVSRFAPTIEAASYRHGVDANLLAIVILVESGGDPYAQSPAGAKGLMQLMPATAADVASRRGIVGHNELRLLDPAYNIDLGAWYLARQIERFWTGQPDATVDQAAAAYNGGPGRLARNEPMPLETQSYVRWVGGMWRERHLPYSDTFGGWMRAGGDRLVSRATTAPIPPLLTAGGPFLANDT